MILENSLIRITLDPATGALRELFDKTSGLNVISARGDHERTAGVNALFGEHAPATHTQQRDAAMSAVTSVATSADATLRRTQTITLKQNERACSMDVTIANLSPDERDALWGERFEFQVPNDGSDRVIQAPAVSYFDPKEVPVLRMRWPHLADGTDLSRVQPVKAGETRTYFLTDFAEGTCSVVSATAKLSIALTWDAQVFSYCWLEERDESLTLAPHCGMPNALEEGHGTLTLPAHGSLKSTFGVRVTSLD